MPAPHSGNTVCIEAKKEDHLIMIEQDTVKLLRECDSGTKMGMDSLRDVQDRARNKDLQTLLQSSRVEHERLAREIEGQLNRFRDEGKQPSAIAEGMSWIKTHVELLMDGSDEKIADLMTDGCNMGVKSLSRYLNQYAAADETSKDLAKQLIGMEDRLSRDLRAYL